MYRLRGFTLIELLVVIAIIALLMAILTPTLNRAKKQARSTACLMNLHHWGVIWSMYCDENDGYFPVSEIKGGSGYLGWRRGTWIVALRPQYETRTEILMCPMARKRHPSGSAWGGPFHTYIQGGGGVGDRREECSYGGNCWIYKPLPGQTACQGRPTKWNWKSKDVKGGDRIPIFADAMWRGGGPFYQSSDPYNNRIRPPEFDGQWLGYNKEMMHFCINRHNGFINATFLDWSARKIGLKELWKMKWHRQFNINGPWTVAGGVMPTDWPEWMRSFKDY
ncbi:MAG: type II secretion system protein [Sedimentisphaerales bacterium]